MITQKYQAARSILTACVFVGWAFVGIGALLALVSLNDSGPFSFYLPVGIASAVNGLFMVLVCQVAFAIFDQAESSNASLQVLKMIAVKQDVDLSSLEQATTMPNSPEPSIAAKVEMREDGAMVRQYKGREIVKIDKRYYVDETQFSTLGKAQRAITEGKV